MKKNKKNINEENIIKDNIIDNNSESESLVASSDDDLLIDDNPVDLSEASSIEGEDDFVFKPCHLPLKAQVESILFASDRPMKTVDVQEIIGDSYSAKSVNDAIHELMEEHQNRGGGFKLVYLKGHGYQFQTVADASPLMERQFASRPRPLSRAAQETLAIIAYRQPVTRAEIEFIRGVDAGSIMKGLLDRNFIKCVGRKEVAGRPMLFGTTDDFLKTFGISALDEIPPLDAFQPEQKMVSEAMSAIESGLDPEAQNQGPQGFMSDEERSASELDVGEIEKPIELSEDLQKIKESSERSQQKIEKILGDDQKNPNRIIEGASVTDESDEIDNEQSHNQNTKMAESERD